MLSENNGGGMNYSMPVAPANYGGGFGFGGDNDMLALLILFGLFGGGFGGFGGWGGMGMMMDGGWGLYPWLNNSQNINDGFREQMLNTNVQGIQTAITGGFGDLQTALCGGFAGVTAAVNGAQNALAQQMYTNQMADMERSYGVQSALQNCCCENRAGIADLKYTAATEACATRTADAQNTQAVLTALNNGVQSIKDQMCADKLSAKDDIIAQLRSELLYARGQASQDVQTATIQAGQRALANEVEQFIAPKANPAYIVQNPNCCYNACGTNCGCGIG